jgi:hypothetical protein
MADDTLTKVLDAMRANPLKGRGAVYRWLWTHHDDLVKAFAETDSGWAAVSDAMRKAGIVGARGKPPTRKSLPKVWQRVTRDKVAAAAGQNTCGAQRPCHPACLHIPDRRPSNARHHQAILSPLPSHHPLRRAAGR